MKHGTTSAPAFFPPLIRPGLGLGLTNVRRRLEVTYGERSEFEHGPKAGGGYMARLTIPAERA